MKNSRIVIIGVTCLLLLAMANSAEPNIYDSTADFLIPNNTVVSYTTHSTVLIQNNEDFVSQGWSGYGNSSHPYTFSGYKITSNSVCIKVTDTTAHFVIRDCLFDSVSGNHDGTGIELYNTSNGQIINCTFLFKLYGLDVMGSNYTYVEDNIFEDCNIGFLNRYASYHSIFHNNTLRDITYAMYLYEDRNTTLTFNNVSNCLYAAYTRYVNDNLFANNTIIDGYAYGFYILESLNVTIQNNTITNSVTGIRLRSSLRCNILKNFFTNNGMQISTDNDNVLEWNHTVESNVVNGKSLGYFWNETKLDISGSSYGQIILANCSSVNVNGGVFHDSSYGVLIGYGFNCSISDSTIYDNGYGIYAIRSENTTLENIEVYESAHSGISLRLSNFSIVSNATVHDSGDDGIQVLSGDYNTIKDSLIYNNDERGILLELIPGFDYTRYNTIYNNTIGWNQYNAEDPIAESWWDYLGVGNAWSDYNGVGDYLINPSDNADHYPSRALYIEDLSNVTIAYDTAGHELNWSAIADRPDAFEIYRDDVIIDDGVWNGSSLRVSLDGLVEGIYNFTIFVNHSTGYSTYDTVWVHVIDDTTSPSTSEPDDITIPYGQLGNEISWIGIDENPDTYIVYRNNSVFETGSWTNGSVIGISLNGFDIGTYNMTIILFDLAGLNMSDTVWVSVEVSESWPDDVFPTINEPTDIVYSEGTTDNLISWTPEDEFPSSYEVFKNGYSIAFGLWNSSSESILISIDGLQIGMYNFTLFVRDVAGNQAFDTVFVSVVDDTSPTLNHPLDISYSEGETGYSATWNPSDTHPDFYEIYRNGTLISTANWIVGTNILIVVDGLSNGTWNYTIIVFDESGNSAIDTVMVNVNEVSTSPTDTTPTGTDPTNTTSPEVDPELVQIMMITVTIGSFVVIIVFVILIFRSRK